MAIASRLKWFLDVNRVQYEVLPDAPAEQAVPDGRRVVSRLFHSSRGYVMVVHPASHQIAMPALEQLAGRPLHAARDSEARDIFFDCQKGAIPPLGPAYGIPTIIDDSLSVDGDVYFNAGAASDWVHMNGAEFEGLVADAPHGPVSQIAKSA